MSDGIASLGFPQGRSRRDLMRLAGRGDDVPELDMKMEASQQVVGWFFELRKFCPSSEVGLTPIQPSLIMDWQELTGEFISRDFSAIIVQMDVAFRAGMSKTQDYFNARNK